MSRLSRRRRSALRRGRPIAPVAVAGLTLISLTSFAHANDVITLTDGTRVSLDGPAVPGGPAQWSVSLPGADWTDARDSQSLIMLRRGNFDPLGFNQLPALPAHLQSMPGEQLRIVQFHTSFVEGYRTELELLGAEVHAYLPQTAFIVRMNDDVRDAAAALPFVRWIGDYAPADRLDETLHDLDVEDQTTSNFDVRMIDPDADRGALIDAIEAIGGSVPRPSAGKLYIEASLTNEQLFAAARFDEVLFIDRASDYEVDMNIARAVSGANVLEAVAGYTGQGVRGEVMDGGFNPGHVDFSSRPLISHNGSGSGNHGASCSGIIFGDGTGDSSKRGLLPDGQGIIANYNNGIFSGTGRYNHSSQLVGGVYRAVFQSCSFGSNLTTQYSNRSAELDRILFDFDFSIMQSQSNQGSTASRPEAWAKNIVSVGGVRHNNNTSFSDDNWGGGASVGPAQDGRIKPDITHFYESIGTVTGGGSTAYTTGFGGTSGATPIVAGYVGLIYQMWADGIFGNDVDPDGDVFSNRCHNTTAKAILINQARPYDWTAGGSNSDLIRVRQGWGMPSVTNIYDERDRLLVIDESEVLSPFETATFEVNVPDDQPEFRATLTWRDPEGTTSAGLHRINDLDLIVTSPTGVVYRGNVGLSSDIWSTPGGSADTINTVENVFINNPGAGLWTIEVEATSLNGDNHLETGSLDADFALVVTGFEEVPPLLVDVLNAPEFPIAAVAPYTIDVRIQPGTSTLIPDGAFVIHRMNPSDDEVSIPLVPTAVPNMFTAALPGVPCGSMPDFHVIAAAQSGDVVFFPEFAPVENISYEIGTFEVVVDDDFESDAGFTVVNVSLSDGAWDRGVPAGGGDRRDPPTDFDGSGACWLTDNVDGNSDVDGGPTRLTTPVYDLEGIAGAEVSYARWWSQSFADSDAFTVEISNDDGATWVVVEAVTDIADAWVEHSFIVDDFVAPTSTVRLRFSAVDTNNTITEAGLDALLVTGYGCVIDPGVFGDLDGDGLVGFSDLLVALGSWGPCPLKGACIADLDGDGIVAFGDIVALLAAFD